MPRTTVVEPPGCPPQLRAICCDELGFVKVVQGRPQEKAETGPLGLVARWGEPSRLLEIVAMSYSSGESRNSLTVGRKSGMIDVLDTSDGRVCAQVAVPVSEGTENRQGRDRICGVHLFKQDQWQNNVLSCKEDGTATLQHFNDLEDTETSVVARWDLQTPAGKILSMNVDASEHFAAFGGEGVELNLWDLDSKSRIWEAKQPRRDRLGLIPPAFVSSSTFLSKDTHRKIVIGTGDAAVRLYDVQAQRRAVLSFTYGESPIKAVSADPDGFTLYIGNAVGSMATYDTRTGKQLGGFKGKLAGSVRSIARHPTLPVIASCGLDRFLRVHDIGSRELLSKIFLKLPLVGVVFDELAKDEASNELEGGEGVMLEKVKRKREMEKTKRKRDGNAAASESEQSDEDGDSDLVQVEAPSKKKRKKPKLKRKQSDANQNNGNDLQEDESPKKKAKKKTQLKRKQTVVVETSDENEDASPKKKPKKKAQVKRKQAELPNLTTEDGQEGTPIKEKLKKHTKKASNAKTCNRSFEITGN